MTLSKRSLLVASIAFLLALCPSGALMGCEPIFPLMKVVAGPSWLVPSLQVLCVIVLIKALLFAVLQRGLKRWLAVIYMFLANVLSTVVGIVVAVALGGVPVLWLIFIPVIWGLSLLPAKRLRLVAVNSRIRACPTAALAAIMTILLVASAFVFWLGQGAAGSNQLVLYWLLKVLYIWIALGISLLITVFWEEWAVASLASGSGAPGTFIDPVFRANAVALALAAIFGAISIWPARLQAADHLVSLIVSWLSHAA